MSLDSEIQLLEHIEVYFETYKGNVDALREDLSEIIQMTSMMMSDDHMWDYTVELCTCTRIWKSLDAAMLKILNKEEYSFNELRILKGIVLMIRNLSIAYKELNSDVHEFTNDQINKVIELCLHLSKIYNTETNEDILLKSLDISIVCFHCVFNFIQTSEKEDPIFIKNAIKILNTILLSMNKTGRLFELRQILPQFKAFSMIQETRIEIEESTIFINLLSAMTRILDLSMDIHIEELSESSPDVYKMILMLAHSLTFLFGNEKIGMLVYKLEQSSTNANANSVLLFLIACQFTFSSTGADPTWDFVAIGAVMLEFFNLYVDKCTSLLQEKTTNGDLRIYHRKLVSFLDIISNLLPYELFKKTISSYEFLPKLIDFFHVVESNTERKRLKDEQTINSDKKSFGNVKTILIEIITYLVHNDVDNQNLVREKGGLVLILNNCNLDVNEPFIRERSILCLKYLLENNIENQKFIESLDPKGIEINEENEKVLEKAGYEVEIVDGKVQLKHV